MSILNDAEIRRLSLPPTHKYTDGFGIARFFARVGDKIYSMQNGHAKPFHVADEWVIGLRPLTDSEVTAYCAIYPRMIEPFAPERICARERELNTTELSSTLESVAPEHTCDEGERTRMVGGGENIVSYGLSSYGYDVRCADEFKIFTNVNTTIVDPKNFDDKTFVTVKGAECIIPPNSFALARTIERFNIPRNILTLCLGKSIYARCGIVMSVTPFEPEWEGYVTLEFSNTTPLPAKIYANEGVAQMLFFQSDKVCENSYRDRSGKNQYLPADAACPKE
jgi:dCTP deaminase